MSNKNWKNQLSLTPELALEKLNNLLRATLLLCSFSTPVLLAAQEQIAPSSPSQETSAARNQDQQQAQPNNLELNNLKHESAELPTSENVSMSLSADEKNEQSAPPRHFSQTKLGPWIFLHPYSAKYAVFSDNDKLGEATRNLKRENNQWKIQLSTQLSKWMLNFKSNEFSTFHLAGNNLKVSNFFTSTKVTFKSARVIEQNFDWEKAIETGRYKKHQWALPLEGEVYDRMSHLVKLRYDIINGAKSFEYQVSYKGSHKIYSYENYGKERVKTPYGEFDTIRLNRVKGDDSNFSIWLSPELNYFPVKIAQIEQDKPDVIMLLSDFQYLDTEAIASVQK